MRNILTIVFIVIFALSSFAGEEDKRSGSPGLSSIGSSSDDDNEAPDPRLNSGDTSRTNIHDTTIGSNPNTSATLFDVEGHATQEEQIAYQEDLLFDRFRAALQELHPQLGELQEDIVWDWFQRLWNAVLANELNPNDITAIRQRIREYHAYPFFRAAIVQLYNNERFYIFQEAVMLRAMLLQFNQLVLNNQLNFRNPIEIRHFIIQFATTHVFNRVLEIPGNQHHRARINELLAYLHPMFIEQPGLLVAVFENPEQLLNDSFLKKHFKITISNNPFVRQLGPYRRGPGAAGGSSNAAVAF